MLAMNSGRCDRRERKRERERELVGWDCYISKTRGWKSQDPSLHIQRTGRNCQKMPAHRF
jgi:hypothetical protein